MLAKILPSNTIHYAEPHTRRSTHRQTAASPHISWSENRGWMNWRDAGGPVASRGVTIDTSGRFLKGFMWAENVGYINLGSGSPANGIAYANTRGSNFGVNIDIATGELVGLAWGENVGWINLDLSGTGQCVGVVAGDGCDSIDFNNDGLFPDSQDLEAFLRRMSGGPCL